MLYLLLDSLDIPANVYYIPSYASCPVCGGIKTIRITGDRSPESIDAYLYCEICGTQGSVSDWVDILEALDNGYMIRKTEATSVYTDACLYYTERAVVCDKLLRRIGCQYNTEPPGGAFTILSHAELLRISTKKTALNEEYKLAFPIRNAEGAVLDFMLLGMRGGIVRAGSGTVRGYCGNIRTLDHKRVFCVHSLSELAILCARGINESIPEGVFNVIMEVPSPLSSTAPSILSKSKHSITELYRLLPGTYTGGLPPNAVHNMSCTTRIIKNYDDMTASAIIVKGRASSEAVLARTSVKRTASAHPYKFFLEGKGAIYAAPHIYSKPDAVFEPVPVVSGLIGMWRCGKGLYNIITKDSRDCVRNFTNVPEEVMLDRHAFNSYINNFEYNGYEKGVTLLEWFDNKCILANVVCITETLTGDILKKEAING